MSAGSLHDFYDVTTIVGGSKKQTVSICRQKEKVTKTLRATKESRGSFWSRMGHVEEKKEYILRSVTMEEDEAGLSLFHFYEKIEKIMELRHPNIAKIYEYFEGYGKVHIVVELCQGENLVSRLPYSEAEAGRLISSILATLGVFHNVGMPHLSLNLENFHFSSQNSKKLDIKLVDFGLARGLDPPRWVESTEKDKLYATAPEIFLGTYSLQADIWSIGVICFILLSAQVPFGNEDFAKNISRGRYSFHDRVWKIISKDAKDFISKCLVVDPKERITLEQAKNHRWLSNPGKQSNSCPDEEEKMFIRNTLKGMAFKKRAINEIAEISSMEDIVNIAQWCFHADRSKTGMTTFGNMKRCLEEREYSVEFMEHVFYDNEFQDHEQLEFRDFLAAILETRGTFEEAVLTQTFESSFPEENSLISKFELAGLLKYVGAPERVEEFFDESEADKQKSHSPRLIQPQRS